MLKITLKKRKATILEMIKIKLKILEMDNNFIKIETREILRIYIFKSLQILNFNIQRRTATFGI